MHRNLAASRRQPRPAARRRRKPSSYTRGAGATTRRTWTAPKVVLLSCAAMALLAYYRIRPAPSGPVRRVDGLLGGNGTEGIDSEEWKRLAGWGDIPLSDLEDWAPLGPDPQGCLPRTSARPEAQPQVVVGWGFGSPELTLYTYRALESILHVYPGAHVKIITVGPRYAYFYKWANIIALTQFQKYSKRGYDVKVEIYFGKMQGKTMMKGWAIPGHKWWRRNEESLLYGKGMKISTFQAIQEAVPDAYVTIFLALLELYTHGGIYVDLTTFFVAPLPTYLDGFVAGGQGQGVDGGTAGDCSTPTTGGRRQRPFVMQYHAPQHPVVACALREYDEEVSALNECIVLSKGNGRGGMDCVLEALEACTEKEGLTNDLRLSGVVEWHGCDEEIAVGYTNASSTGASGMDTLEAIAGIPPRLLPYLGDDGEDDIYIGGKPARLQPVDTEGVSTAEVIKGLLSKPGDSDDETSGTPEEAKDLLAPSSSTEDGEGEDGDAETVSENTGGGDTAVGGGDEEGQEKEVVVQGEGGIAGQLAASLSPDDVSDTTPGKEESGEARKGMGTEADMESQEEEVAVGAKLAASATGDDSGSGGGGAVEGGGGAEPAPETEDELLGALVGAGIGGGGEEEALEGLEERSEEDLGGYGSEEESGLEEAGSGSGGGGGEGEVAGSRASVSTSTADADAAAVQEERRQIMRRRRLASSGGGADAAGAGMAERGETEAEEARRGRAGAGAGAGGGSRALVSRGTFSPVTPDKVSLMWMGPQATDGLWRAPDEDSLWAEAFARLRLTRWKPQQVSASCRIPCGHWDTLSPEGSKASEAAKAQASFQCAPRVFVPGTQKGASTFLFHAISWHPQMVQPLRGAHGFKETGRYSPGVATGPEKLGLRLAAFPYIEEHENFATGDGSVIYMLHNMKTPEAILADNPHAKIVFALRDPVARAWSDFRFLWGVYQKQEGFPSVVEMSLDKTRACFEGHMGEDPQPFDFGDGGPGQLTMPEEEEEAIQHFFSRCSTVKDPGQIVRKGIYYYQVLHWMRVFGRDNVMIVDSADLKSRQKETIEEVYRFLGLCPVDISKLEPENVTNSPNIPEHMKITAESYKALQDFYEPFNKKLYKLLGRDLGWEKNTFKARRR